MVAHEQRLTVAVVGAGIAGMTAAYLLDGRHDVTLIERNAYIGGHTNTIDVDEGGRHVPVDTGFIVCNATTYPLFYTLLDRWGVARRDTDMSFGFSCERTGLAYVGPRFHDIMQKPMQLLDRRLIRIFMEQRRFNRRVLDDLEHDRIDDRMLDEYLRDVGVSDFFIDNYLVPLAGSVWSSSDNGMLHFPSITFFTFLRNHGLLQLRGRPQWQTVIGGSQTYVRAFLEGFSGTVMTGARVASIARNDVGATIRIEGREPQRFDHVILAMHANESLACLEDPSPEESAALSSWSYHTNTVQLHRDTSVMPSDRRVWASWNYHRRADADPDRPVPITYNMNRLQGLETTHDYLVSLNATHLVDPDAVIYEVDYDHPMYTTASVRSQQRLRSLNGIRRTAYCGAHLGYGFHEDGVASAVEACAYLGATL